jgi:indolepyruvate ferredoxin oxidoreductase
LAAKDEYEVARLLLDDGELARLKNTFGNQAKVQWHLRPTFLRSLGVKHKVKLGTWFTPILRMLRWAKRLRRTPLDLFGRTHIRRMERALIVHYKALLSSLCAKLNAATYADAVKLAALPDMVRGYEDVKAHNIAQYLDDARQLAGVIGLPWPSVEAFSVPQTSSELQRAF